MTPTQVILKARKQLALNKKAENKAVLEAKFIKIKTKSQMIQDKAILAANVISCH